MSFFFSGGRVRGIVIFGVAFDPVGPAVSKVVLTSFLFFSAPSLSCAAIFGEQSAAISVVYVWIQFAQLLFGYDAADDL